MPNPSAVPACQFSCRHHTAASPSVETRGPSGETSGPEKKILRAIDSRKNIV
jgi:hypothetical protein